MGFLSVQHLSTHDLPPSIHPCLVRWRSHSSVVLKEACQEMLFVLAFEIKNHESLPLVPCVRVVINPIIGDSTPIPRESRAVLVPLVTVQVERADKGPLCTAAHMSDCSLCHEVTREERILNR